MIERATAAFEAFDYAQALLLTEDFFWRVFCDNYLELAKPRTYEETLSAGRLSAAATLRILHRAVLRMFAPYLPYITEEVWHWAYSGDQGMNASVHRSPWPSLEELADIPEPAKENTYALTIEVLDAVRKAKADANLSIKAPAKRVSVTASADQCAALAPTISDITRMLQIESLELSNAGNTDTLNIEVELAL